RRNGRALRAAMAIKSYAAEAKWRARGAPFGSRAGHNSAVRTREFNPIGNKRRPDDKPIALDVVADELVERWIHEGRTTLAPQQEGPLRCLDEHGLALALAALAIFAARYTSAQGGCFNRGRGAHGTAPTADGR